VGRRRGRAAAEQGARQRCGLAVPVHGGRDWVGWGAPVGDGDAVCAFDWEWEVVVVAVDDG
jgi:hypothetical protein